VAEERPVYETLLDCLLYAPLGAAVVFVEEVPRLAERGRERIAVARLVGRFAAEEACRRLRAPSSGPSREQAHQSKEGSRSGFFTPNGAASTTRQRRRRALLGFRTTTLRRSKSARRNMATRVQLERRLLEPALCGDRPRL